MLFKIIRTRANVQREARVLERLMNIKFEVNKEKGGRE